MCRCYLHRLTHNGSRDALATNTRLVQADSRAACRLKTDASPGASTPKGRRGPRSPHEAATSGTHTGRCAPPYTRRDTWTNNRPTKQIGRAHGPLVITPEVARERTAWAAGRARLARYGGAVGS